MAMFISKFHRLIQSKLFWSLIIGVMVVTMVLSMVPGVRDWSDFVRGFSTPEAGTLNGEVVTAEEYATAATISRRSPGFSPERESAPWKWLAVQRKALELGLVATRQEIVAQVAREVSRQTNGQWDSSLYNMYLSRVAEQNDIPSNRRDLAEDLLVQNDTANRVLGLYGGAVLVTPAEVQNTFSGAFDSFDLEVAVLPPPAASTNAAVSVTPEKLRAHYEQNKDTYRTPKQRRAVYTTINASVLADTNKVSEAVAKAHYEKNLSKYLRPASTNVADLLTVTNQFKAFAEVRGEIVAELAMDAAMVNAKADSARIFENLLWRDRRPPRYADGAPKTLEVEAALYGVATTEWFSASSWLPGIEVGREFTRAVYDLGTNTIGEVTEPVMGKSNIYIARLLEARPERVPPLEEIASRVEGDVRRRKEAEATLEAAKKLRDLLAAKVAEGGSFTNAAAAAGMTVRLDEGIARAGGDTDLPAEIWRELAAAVPGYIPPAAASFDGSHVIVRVLARTPADPAKLAEVKGRIQAGLQRGRAMAAATTYKDQIIKAAVIVPEKGYAESDKKE